MFNCLIYIYLIMY